MRPAGVFAKGRSGADPVPSWMLRADGRSDSYATVEGEAAWNSSNLPPSAEFWTVCGREFPADRAAVRPASRMAGESARRRIAAFIALYQEPFTGLVSV